MLRIYLPDFLKNIYDNQLFRYSVKKISKFNWQSVILNDLTCGVVKYKKFVPSNFLIYFFDI